MRHRERESARNRKESISERTLWVARTQRWQCGSFCGPGSGRKRHGALMRRWIGAEAPQWRGEVRRPSSRGGDGSLGWHMKLMKEAGDGSRVTQQSAQAERAVAVRACCGLVTEGVSFEEGPRPIATVYVRGRICGEDGVFAWLRGKKGPGALGRRRCRCQKRPSLARLAMGQRQ